MDIPMLVNSLVESDPDGISGLANRLNVSSHDSFPLDDWT